MTPPSPSKLSCLTYRSCRQITGDLLGVWILRILQEEVPVDRVLALHAGVLIAEPNLNI